MPAACACVCACLRLRESLRRSEVPWWHGGGLAAGPRQAGYGDLCVIKDGEERLRQRLKTTLLPAAVEREVRQMVICALLGGLQQVRRCARSARVC